MARSRVEADREFFATWFRDENPEPRPEMESAQLVPSASAEVVRVTQNEHGHDVVDYSDGRQEVLVPAAQVYAQPQAPRRGWHHTVGETPEGDGFVNSYFAGGLPSRFLRGIIDTKGLDELGQSSVGHAAISSRGAPERKRGSGMRSESLSWLAHSRQFRRFARFTAGLALVNSVVYGGITHIGGEGASFIDITHPTNMLAAPLGDIKWLRDVIPII